MVTAGRLRWLNREGINGFGQGSIYLYQHLMELPLLPWSWQPRPKIKEKRVSYVLRLAKETTGSQRTLRGLLGDGQNGYDTPSVIAPPGP